MAKSKLDYLAEALAEFGLSTASQLPATAYGGYKAATTPGGFTDRLRAFQPRGAAAPEALKQGLARYGEWSAENPTASIAGNALKREIFRGPKGDLEIQAAEKALEQIDNGADPADVWRADRWARHPKTGQPVTEIDDSAMKMIARPGTNPMQMEQVIEHPELFKATPSARLVDTVSEGNYGGTFYVGRDKIGIGKKLGKEDFLDTMVHELDHRTAKQFGLPKGGTASQFGYDKHLKKIRAESSILSQQLRELKDNGVIDPSEHVGIVNKMNTYAMNQMPMEITDILEPFSLTKPEKDKLTTTLMGWNSAMNKKNEAYDKYRNISGEAMARLTTKRRKLTGAERGEDYPFDPNYFKRLTGSKIEDLTDPVPGGGVQ